MSRMIAAKGRGSADRFGKADPATLVASQKRASASPERAVVRDRRQSAPARNSSSAVPLASVAEQELLRATVTGSPTALVVADLNGVALLWNPAAERLFGWSAAEVVGRPLRLIEFSSRGESHRLRRGAAAGHNVFEVQAQRRHRDGHMVEVAVSTVGLHDPSGRVIAVLGTYQDITERKAAEDELVRQAHRDDLTGLVNRRGLLEELQHLQSGRRRRFAVVAFDLDHFKHVNDAFGRAVGDEVLAVFARRLVNSVRPGDVVARLEGALFAVLMMGVEPRALESTVGRLLAAVTQRYDVAGQQTAVKVTGGVAGCSRLEEPAEMVRRAEVALHYAKRVSRGGFQVLDEALDRAFLDRGWLAAHLLDAADRGELRLHFQPIVSAVSREMVGVEALVRWEHPERGLLGPNEFIPLAEESGSISSIGRWVLREACATLRHWTEAEPAAAHLSVSVNLSVAELQDRNLVKDVAEALKRSGLAPERLHLEVTESVLSTDPEAAARALAQLRDVGVWLVIDDFGTGHSSLTALQRFPFRVLKIDRSFVGGIGIRPADETIVTATLALAHGLGLSVVAEGVETPEQAEFLTRGGCEELQGYLCGRPAPAAVIQPLLGVECLRRTA
jgi:diguanylate cyclase (GGDEF)-like protein/PAS domain S-box-containing protein